MSARPANALEGFFSLLIQFKRLSICAIIVGVAVPFVANMAGITPPWPPGVELITAVVELIALAVAFHFLYQPRYGTRKRATRFLLVSGISLIVSAILYILMFSVLVHEAGIHGEKVVRGFTCLPHIAQTYSGCPMVTDEVFQGVGYEPGRIWTPFSIYMARAALVLGWMTSFIFLAAFFGAFVVYYSGQPPRKSPQQK